MTICSHGVPPVVDSGICWGGGWPAGAGVSRLTTVRERNYWKFRDANALLLLLFLFDCGTNLGNDIGAEPRGYSEQSRCDLPCALDGEGLGAEPLAAKAYAAPERRRLLRADRHGRLQTGELGRGQDEVDHERTSMACWAKSRPARLGGAPFVIPDLETSDVQQKGPSAKVQRDPFHQQLVLREDRVAGVARFAAAWTTPKPSDTVMWQAPVPDLALDEKTERFLVHGGLPGSNRPRTSARLTGVSTPGGVYPKGQGAGRSTLAQGGTVC